MNLLQCWLDFVSSCLTATDGRSAIKMCHYFVLFHLKFNKCMFTLSVLLAPRVADSDFTLNTDYLRGFNVY